jgi:dipeptidase E
MKLLLTSAGITNKTIAQALRELLGKPSEECRAVFVPTAANLEKGDRSWVETEMNSLKNVGFASFDVVDIASVPQETWRPIFEKADVIGVGGGNDRYLLTQLNKSGLETLLPELLRTKVYMGISAGSIATATRVSLSYLGILYYERTKKFKDDNGLGFVDFEIRPHLNSPGFPKVRLDYLSTLAKANPTPFYALDDNSAVKVDGDTITVVSEGEWKKFNS